MRRIIMLLLVVLIALCMGLPVLATMPTPEDVIGVDDSAPVEQESVIDVDSGVYLPGDFTLPAGVAGDITPYALPGGVYDGAIGTQYAEYFAAVMLQYPGVPYLLYRSGQYTYTLIYGDGLQAVGSRITGSGTYNIWTTNGGGSMVRGNDSVSVDVGGSWVYTNIIDGYARLEVAERGADNKIILLGVVFIFVLLVLFRLIFGRR